MTDPIVEEVRKHRDEHSRQFNYDLNLICEDYRKHRVERLARFKNANKTMQPKNARCISG